MDSGLLSLKWNHHNVSFQNMLSSIRTNVLFSDVTLACGGKLYPVHKLVLSTCSEYFEVMLQETHCKHPVIVLKDISCTDLTYLLDFMYIGEVNVPQTKLSGLIEAAECLRIRGLAVPDESEQDIIVKGAPLRNEKLTVNSHMRNKRLREESLETPHKRGQRSNDHAKHTKSSGVEGNNNGHKSTAMEFTDRDDSLRTEKSTSERTHMKDRNTTSSVVEIAPLDIKEELDNSPLQDHIIALQNENMEDITSLEKKTEQGTLACSVSEANNRHRKSPAFGSSSLDFKEDMSHEFSTFDERSNGHQLNVSGDDDELQSLSFPSPPQPPYQRDGANPSSLHNPLDDFPPFLPHQQHLHPFGGDLSLLHNSQAASGSSSSLGFLADDAVQSFASLNTPFGSAQSSADALTSNSLGSLTTMPYIKMGRGPDSFKQCPFCPYKTQLTGNIKKHILGHTGCKPFACHMCSYRTNEKSNLNRHVRCHLVKATQIRGDLKPSNDA